jgi:hypothetical protein
MATATYIPIATQTVATSGTTLVTFTSIPSTYTDLKVIISANAMPLIRFNTDSSSSYSDTQFYGNGSSAFSGYDTNNNWLRTAAVGGNGTNPLLITLDIFSYSGNTNKSCISTAAADINGSGGGVNAIVALWRNTSAINRIDFDWSGSGYTANAGSTITIWGI